jgi:hypothetical protein
MEMLGVAPLAFAMGMYIPIAYNTPILLGGYIAHRVQKSAKKDEGLANARREKGTLIASGFIAGGALMGVIGALLRFIETSYGVSILPDFANAETSFGNWLGAGMLIALCVYIFFAAKSAKKEA